MEINNLERTIKKERLYIHSNCSKSIKRAITFLTIIAWIPVAIGLFLCIGSIINYIHDFGMMLTGISIGLLVGLNSALLFVIIAFMKGFAVITENNEYQKAEFEQKYDIRD